MGLKWSVVQLVHDFGIGPLPAPLDGFRRGGVVLGRLGVGLPAHVTFDEEGLLLLGKLEGADKVHRPFWCHGLQQGPDGTVTAVQASSPRFFLGRFCGRLGGLGGLGFFGSLAPVLIFWLCLAMIIHRW